MYCSNCGEKLGDGVNVCPKCGTTVESKTKKQEQTQKGFSASSISKENISEKIGGFADKVSQMAGGQEHVELKFADLFTGMFKKHSKEEAEELFICGTSNTTPKLQDIATEWPHPWLFLRVGVYLALTFVLLFIMSTTFNNPNAYPGVMFIGAMVMPFTVLVFMFELNAPRNISFYAVIQNWLLGGALSLVITLFLYNYVHYSDNYDLFSAIIIGIVEEAGKVLAVAITIRQTKNCKYILNGLLLGGAIGAGFAVFESMGYSFMQFLYGADGFWGLSIADGFAPMIEVTILRGVLAPGGHVAWAAIEGAAIMIVLRKEEFSFRFLTDKRFLSLTFICIVLHAAWDWADPVFRGSLGYIKLGILIVAAWIVILVLLNNGLKEINDRVQMAQGGE